jgi:hypothetical protein
MADRMVVAVVVNKVLAMVSGLLMRSLEILPLMLRVLLLLLVVVERGDILEILVLLVRRHTHTHLRQRIPAVYLFHHPHVLHLHKRVPLLLPLVGR